MLNPFPYFLSINLSTTTRPDVGRLQLPQEDDDSTGTVTPREEVVPPGKVRFIGRVFVVLMPWGL